MEPSIRHMFFWWGEWVEGSRVKFSDRVNDAEWQLDRMFYATRWVYIVRARQPKHHWFDVIFETSPHDSNQCCFNETVRIAHQINHILMGQFQGSQGTQFFWTTGIAGLEWCYFFFVSTVIDTRSSITYTKNVGEKLGNILFRKQRKSKKSPSIKTQSRFKSAVWCKLLPSNSY